MPVPGSPGDAVLLATVLLATVMLTVYLGRFDGPALRRTKDDRTAQALAQAKEALIGYATSNQTLPASLPCPDISNSGQAAGAERLILCPGNRAALHWAATLENTWPRGCSGWRQ